MNLTDDDVREIIRLIDSSHVHELRIKTEKFDLCLRRSAAGWTRETKTLTRPDVIGGVEAAPAATSDTPAQAKSSTQDEACGVVAIRTPIVGTFYRAPKPGAPPFVEIGSEVDGNSVVGIVETMKLMNSVSAGAAGTVIEVCVADGEFVESDQVLMRLRRTEA